MPCTLREKRITYYSRRNKSSDSDVNAPKPVHPRALHVHGLFGMSYVKQHMMADERWAPDSLTDQFKRMTDLLAHRITFKRHELKANYQRYSREHYRLKDQCRDGRAKLQNVLNGDNSVKIRNLLINRKDLQRLYQNMPIELVTDNINQRTFVLRKERDRLQHRLCQLKDLYKTMLVEEAALENRLQFQNEFVLEEEVKSRTFLKKIENSKVRLSAIQTINNTYKKMVQVLVHEEAFYEPILRSLTMDMEDQANFIKHVLYLGKPAVAKFTELNAVFRSMDDKARKSLKDKMLKLSELKQIKHTHDTAAHKGKEEQAAPLVDLKRYVRETQSMLVLKSELQYIEHAIKKVKSATLCSQAKEIYPRMKSQVDNNIKLQGIIENEMMAHEHFQTKSKRASVLKGILLNNLSEEEINRQERIKDLKKVMRKYDDFIQDTLQHLKNRSDVFVVVRLSLWNLAEIMRNVDHRRKLIRMEYPNSYLKLPLLKFEMLNMFSVAPEVFEFNIDNLMHLVQRRLYHLMKGYKTELNSSAVKDNVEEYHAAYLASLGFELDPQPNEVRKSLHSEEDFLQGTKTMANVPNRKSIKVQSAKLIEELAKKEE